MPSRLGIVSSSYSGGQVVSGPQFRSVSTATSTSGSFSISAPTGTSSGDLLLLAVWIKFDAKAGTYGTESYTGWTQRVRNGQFSGDAIYLSIFSKTAGASESSFTWSGGSNWEHGLASIVSISGATSIDVVGTPGLTNPAPSITTTANNDLLLGFFPAWGPGVLGGTEITLPVSMTTRVSLKSSAATDANLSIGTEKLTTSGATGTRSATINSSPYWFWPVLLGVK